MTQILQKGDRVKYITRSWNFNTKTTKEVEKIGTFIRYSDGYAFKNKMVIQIDGLSSPTYLSRSARVVKI